jgi:hypothetical protein
MTFRVAAMVVCACVTFPLGLWAQERLATSSGLLKVYLDCGQCFGNFIREEVDIVEYVRDPAEADVHLIVTSSETGSGGRERTVAFVGLGRFKGMDFKGRALTESADTEDTQRQRLATAIKIGLLNYMSSDGIAGGLTVDVERTIAAGQRGPTIDPWNNWVMSVQGSVEMNGEESSRELNLNSEIGADRITDKWKITMGVEVEHRREDFDLDEDEPVRAIRTQRDFDTLVARSLTNHWSLGGRASVDSSSFDNIALRVFGGPAIEYNLFPYSDYNRRQLRLGYAIGPYRARYVEETLLFKMSDTLAQQQASMALDQREPWGSIQAEVQYSTFLPQPSRYRLQLEGDVNVRLARGLSLSIEGSTSRIRDQLFIPRRGVTPEEVLLRLRRLQSGYEYDFQLGLTYTFGSIFNTIVNPRFGR